MAEGGGITGRWEPIASAAATLITTLAMVFQINPRTLAQATRLVKAAPGWLKVLSSVPMPAWWVAAIVLGAALWWSGMLLRPRYGTPALFVAPVVMIMLQYALPWLLYAPIRAASSPIAR